MLTLCIENMLITHIMYAHVCHHSCEPNFSCCDSLQPTESSSKVVLNNFLFGCITFAQCKGQDRQA